VEDRAHPLHSITGSEILKASAIIRKLVEDSNIASSSTLRFKNVSQHEPPKALLLPYLNAEALGVPPSQRPFVPRCADVVWTIHNEREVYETTVSLDTRTVVSQSKALPGQHSSLDR
jgi:primary-amine oxidase